MTYSKLCCQILALFSILFVTLAWAEDSPQAVIKSTTDSVLSKLGEAQNLKSEGEKKNYYRSVVAEAIGPVVDFPLIARRVMANYYKHATEGQQERFTQVFQESLINTYAAGIAGYADSDVTFLPFAGAEKKGKYERATVEMEIRSKSGSLYSVRYSMYKNSEGQWLLENLVLNGVNLGLTFRNQFSEYMKKYKGDIDQVIANWSSSIAEL